MIRTRFAPSPTGIPHLGNTRTALYNYLFAKHHQGKFILRIEDTDKKRLKPGSLAKIKKILKICQIKWDEGPDVGGPHRPYIQSQRLSIYQKYAHQLVKQQSAYYCFCSPQRLKKLRTLQQQKHQLPKYDRRCLSLSTSKVESLLKQKKPYVIRLKVPQKGTTAWQDLIQGKIEFQNSLLDDQVLLKSDGYPTYHLAVVIDDHLMNITHILRGVEWISSTPKHLLLFKSFNWPVPQIGHFSIILGPDKTKLSKRHGAKSILQFQLEGYLPQALNTFMAYLGWSYQDNSQLLTQKQLIKNFSLKKVQKSNPIFDLQKLNYFNSKLIRQTADSRLIQLIKPYLKFKITSAKLKKIIPLIKDRLITLADINYLTEYFVKDPVISLQAVYQESKTSPQATLAYLKQVEACLQSIKPWQTQSIDTQLHHLQQQSAWQPRQAFMTLRLVLTGRTHTPPLFDVLFVLGKKTVLKRLQYVQDKIKKQT